jgi:hypothetical protein
MLSGNRHAPAYSVSPSEQFRPPLVTSKQPHMTDQSARAPLAAPSTLWSELLPIIREINAYGGNWTCAFLRRSIVEEIDRLADAGDTTLVAKRARIRDALRRGKWPYDPPAFNAIFETYHEALFYLVSASRGVLIGIPEGGASTPDFATRSDFKEHFEVKTIDFAGGQHAYKPITEGGLDEKIKAEAEARRRGIGVGTMVLNPHGKATNNREAIEQVMRQIAGNVKAPQFQAAPTFLVLPMIRTALRTRAEDLATALRHPVTGATVNGHLWTIAAHEVGAPFSSSESTIEHDVAPLNQAGVLLDFPFVRGIVFLHTEWNRLPSADIIDPQAVTDAYRLLGIWNDSFSPVSGEPAPPSQPESSAFSRLCHEWRRFENA